MNREEAKLREKLGSWRWRITSGKIYKIKDKDGNIVPFIPNKYQMDLINNLHYKNLILKARQLGFSTLIQILMLDQCLFNRNVACGVIAQGLKEAKSIFENKVKFAYDNLPEWLNVPSSRCESVEKVATKGKTGRAKNIIDILNDSVDTMILANGSSFYVGTSFRGGTLQYLHVSEYGKICAQQPERAREINTGALEAVSSKNYVFIESTAEGKNGDFYDKAEDSRRLKTKGKVLNSLEYKFFFYAWHEVQEYRINDPFLEVTDITRVYFSKLKEMQGIECDEEQMKWWQLKKKDKKGDMAREYPSYPEEAFKVAVSGAYFAKEVEQVYIDNREIVFPYEPSLNTYVTMDIGVSDSMSVIIYQVHAGQVRILKWYNVSGFGMVQVHRQLIQPLGYPIEHVYLPHDGAVRSANDLQTRAETLQKCGYTVSNMPAMRVMDSIDLSKSVFAYCWFHQNGAVTERDGKVFTLLDMLAQYKEKVDKVSGLGLGAPAHDEASHPGDAFRYMAQSLEYIKQDTGRTPGQTYGGDDSDLI